MGYKTPEVIKSAIEAFKKQPGVGERSAMRNVLHVLKWNPAEIKTYADTIARLTELNVCRTCRTFCDTDQCSLCVDEERKNSKILCVVESFTDFLAIERSEKFKGLYFILGGVLNPLLGVGPNDLNFDLLKERINEEGIEHLILAINPSLEGEATCSYLKELLSPHCIVERIGFGVPLGGSLEYLDPQTISTALDNRTLMS